MENDTIEKHPLKPFLPTNSRLLMLGSFLPPKKRWSMDFYYPNMQNDMWRILGLIFFLDKDYFVNPKLKSFKKDEIVNFLRLKGIALYDTASSVKRLKDNASDKFLEVVEPTNINHLLQQIPCCEAIVTTGQKATDTIMGQLIHLTGKTGTPEPRIGSFILITLPGSPGRSLRFYRMPSSSRAYPLSLKEKASFYREMLLDLKILEK